MEQDRGSSPQKTDKGKSFGQRWADMQPTKTMLFWSCLITAVIVMIIGFNWGGWMTGGSAKSMSEDLAEEAVITRLAPMCVVRFLLDPAKAEKLVELKDMSSYSRGSYIEKQGWATMSGEEKPDRKVAAECAKLLVLLPEIDPTVEILPAPAAATTPVAETTPAAETTPVVATTPATE